GPPSPKLLNCPKAATRVLAVGSVGSRERLPTESDRSPSPTGVQLGFALSALLVVHTPPLVAPSQRRLASVGGAASLRTPPATGWLRMPSACPFRMGPGPWGTQTPPTTGRRSLSVRRAGDGGRARPGGWPGRAAGAACGGGTARVSGRSSAVPGSAGS